MERVELKPTSLLLPTDTTSSQQCLLCPIVEEAKNLKEKLVGYIFYRDGSSVKCKCKVFKLVYQLNRSSHVAQVSKMHPMSLSIDIFPASQKFLGRKCKLSDNACMIPLYHCFFFFFLIRYNSHARQDI